MGMGRKECRQLVGACDIPPKLNHLCSTVIVLVRRCNLGRA